MSRVYYKAAMGAEVVSDVTDSSQWKQDLDSKVSLDSGRPVPAVLLANKCDVTRGDRGSVSFLAASVKTPASWAGLRPLLRFLLYFYDSRKNMFFPSAPLSFDMMTSIKIFQHRV